MTTSTTITGLLRETDGTLSYVDFQLIDGKPCDGMGFPLEATDETETLYGWPFSEARVWKNDGGREILLPEMPAVLKASEMGSEDRAAYIAELGEDPVVGQVGDWDATGWTEVWRTIANEMDIAIDDYDTYNFARVAYLKALFATDDVA
jgi:hypothetical protein